MGNPGRGWGAPGGIQPQPGAVPNSQLPRVSSGLVPLPMARESAAASPSQERRAREAELGAREPPPGAPVTEAQVTGVVPPTPRQPTRSRPPCSSLRRGPCPGSASGHRALVPGALP